MTGTPIDVGEGATVVVASGAQAICRDEVSGETLVGRGAVRAPEQGLDVGVGFADAIGAGVESVLVGGVLVDVFNYVDLHEKGLDEHVDSKARRKRWSPLRLEANFD